MEKESPFVTETSETGRGGESLISPTKGIESKTARLQEASELYGNIATVEEYGYVTRGHVYFQDPFHVSRTDAS